MVKIRCAWCGTDPLYVDYHDCQWGVPVHDDQVLFEMLSLEGAQAGLSWLTILKKREAYIKAFDGFDFEKVAGYSEDDIQRLSADKGIVRNRQKINSVIKNARGVLEIRNEFGSLDTYLWSFVGGVTIQNTWETIDEIPAQTDESQVLSKDLKKRGFSFVGPTICYAFMQSVGMVNDHTTDCFRHEEVQGSRLRGN